MCVQNIKGDGVGRRSVFPNYFLCCFLLFFAHLNFFTFLIYLFIKLGLFPYFG